MAKNMESKMDVSQINFVLQVYGQVVATPGVTDSIKEKCNKQIERLIDTLTPVVDEVVAWRFK